MTYPRKLKSLFVYKNPNASILGSVEDNFFARTSDIMNDFLKVCESLDEKQLLDYLHSKYAPGITKQLLRKVDKYQHVIFQEEERQVMQFDFNKNISTLTLNLSRICNLRCTYCFEGIDFRKSAGMMSKDTAIAATESFINQLEDDKGTIVFTGGEPLLNFDVLREVVAIVEKKDKLQIRFFMKTNGTLISEDICSYLMKHKIELQISLDGNAEVHDYHRKFVNGKESFEEVDKAINLLLEKGYGQKTTLRSTVTHQTVKSIEESYAHLKSYKGIKGCDVSSVMGKKEQSFTMTDDDIVQYLKQVYNIAKEKYLSNASDYNDGLKVDGRCGIGVWHLAIDVNGDIYPCYRLCGIDEFFMGNIDEQDLGTKMPIPDKLMKLYNIDSRDECPRCYAKVFCQKGCYADKLLKPDLSTCNDAQKKVGDYFLVENLVNSDVYMMLPLI